MRSGNDKLRATLAAMGHDFEQSNFENYADEAPQNAVQMPNAPTRYVGGVTDHNTWDSLIVNSKGDLNLTITRQGASIDAALPFVLFGSNDFADSYNATLRTFALPAGTTVTVTTDTATGDILFTYVNGENTDIVRVHNEGSVSMKAFLAGMNNNYFGTKNFLVSISDEASNQQQFGQTLFFGLLSSLGLTGANQLIFRSRTNSWQFRKDRVEILLPEQKIVPEYSFAMRIIQENNFSIGFDFFMSARYNLNSGL